MSLPCRSSSLSYRTPPTVLTSFSGWTAVRKSPKAPHNLRDASIRSPLLQYEIILYLRSVSLLILRHFFLHPPHPLSNSDKHISPTSGISGDQHFFSLHKNTGSDVSGGLLIGSSFNTLPINSLLLRHQCSEISDISSHFRHIRSNRRNSRSHSIVVFLLHCRPLDYLHRDQRSTSMPLEIKDQPERWQLPWRRVARSLSPCPLQSGRRSVCNQSITPSYRIPSPLSLPYLLLAGSSGNRGSSICGSFSISSSASSTARIVASMVPARKREGYGRSHQSIISLSSPYR